VETIGELPGSRPLCLPESPSPLENRESIPRGVERRRGRPECSRAATGKCEVEYVIAKSNTRFNDQRRPPIPGIPPIPPPIMFLNMSPRPPMPGIPPPIPICPIISISWLDGRPNQGNWLTLNLLHVGSVFSAHHSLHHLLHTSHTTRPQLPKHIWGHCSLLFRQSAGQCETSRHTCIACICACEGIPFAPRPRPPAAACIFCAACNQPFFPPACFATFAIIRY
jgi:hypothetical protein